LNILVLHPPNHRRHPSDVNSIATFANKRSRAYGRAGYLGPFGTIKIPSRSRL
jgi:hypothetical protein